MRDPQVEPADPDPRVVLALERTTLAWTRTSLAVMGFGFVVGRLGVFLNELHPAAPTSGRGQWIGLAIVLFGGVLQVVALATHATSVRRLRSTGLLPLRTMSPALIVSACLGALALVVAAYLATL
jgi:putative membrane protein